MRWTTPWLSLSSGLLLGGLLGLLSAPAGPREPSALGAAPAPPAAPPAPPAPAAAPGPAPPTPSPDAAPLRDEIDALATELELLTLQRRLLEAERSRVEGTPLAWPEELPPHQAPEAVEAALLDACARSGVAELVDLDCTEPPCLATLLSTDEGIPGFVSPEDYDPVIDALPPELGAPFVQATSRRTDDGYVRFGVVAVGPAELEGEARARAEHRAEQLAAWASSALEAP